MPVATDTAATGLFWGKTAASLPPDAGEFTVEAAPVAEDEVDISDEWEDQVEDVSGKPEAIKAAASAKEDSKLIEETVEEIRFYLSQSMVEQARSVFARLEKLKAPAQKIAELRREIDATEKMLAYTAPETAEEVSIEEIPDVSAEEQAEPVQDHAFQTHYKTELDAPWAHDHKPKTPPAIIPTPEPVVREVAQASTAAEHAGVLGDFVSDLEDSLGTDFLPQAPAAQSQPKTTPAPAAIKPETKVASTAAPVATMMAAAAAAAPAPAPAPAFTHKPAQPSTSVRQPAIGSKADGGAGIDLADMFGELKQELEEGTPVAQEDPETHYNLGVAFREMGLLDEAIAELQKVCQAIDRGHSFPLVMQTYTWLAQCFLDKGVPEAAIRWYDKAIKLSSIDEETRVALNYELGSAYETAGNRPAALNHFMQVYGSNIDYRDVAERIQALKS
jgi:tetratricopeptide (TPR) repeat protein